MRPVSLMFVALASALTGCSSFQLGGFCYAPARGGQCMATSAPSASYTETAETPAAPETPSTPAAKP